MKGIVYVLSHEAMPGLLKVGYTTRTIKERLQELSSTGVPGSFIPELYFYIDEPHVVEREIHQHLSSFRYEKEFFRVDKTEAIKIIRSLIDHKNLPTDYFFGKSSELASDVLIRNQREVQREREIINESNKLSTLTYTDLKEKYMQLLSSPNATLGLREAKKLKPFLRAHEARISLDRQQQHATNLIKYEAIKPNFLNAIAAINKILLQHVPSKLFGGFFGYSLCAILISNHIRISFRCNIIFHFIILKSITKYLVISFTAILYIGVSLSCYFRNDYPFIIYYIIFYISFISLNSLEFWCCI